MQQKVLVEAQVAPAAEERGWVLSIDLGGGLGFAVQRCSGEAQRRTCSYVHGLALMLCYIAKKKKKITEIKNNEFLKVLKSRFGFKYD